MKQTLSRNGKVHVTFELPAAVEADAVHLCGDFNQWSPSTHPLRVRKDGSRSVTLTFAPGGSYRYRYLLDGERWENDWNADSYVPNDFGSDDSVLIVRR